MQAWVIGRTCTRQTLDNVDMITMIVHYNRYNLLASLIFFHGTKVVSARIYTGNNMSLQTAAWETLGINHRSLRYTFTGAAD